MIETNRIEFKVKLTDNFKKQMGGQIGGQMGGQMSNSIGSSI